MKKIVLTGILIACFISGFGQKIRTLNEILTIIEKSEIEYDLYEMIVKAYPENYTDKLNRNDVYQIESSGVRIAFKYRLKKESKSFIKEADKCYKKGEALKAREFYEKALKFQFELYNIIVCIGQTYDLEKDYDSAIKYYREAVEKNYIDYKAHWLLAEGLARTEKKDEAVKEITIAHILNRNDPYVKTSLEKIYSRNKLNYADWKFNPQVEFNSDKIKYIRIQLDPEWSGYALCNAVWEFEPGYKEKMEEEYEDVSLIKEKECIYCLNEFLSQNKKYIKLPSLKALKKANELGRINDFIYYEVYLPQYPSDIYKFSEADVQNLVDYVLIVRGGKKTTDIGKKTTEKNKKDKKIKGKKDRTKDKAKITK